MKNVNVIVFSKDRALQLEATLRSLLKYTSDLDPSSITVLYKTSHPRYAAQYGTLSESYPQVNFVRENHFRKDLLNILFNQVSNFTVRLCLHYFAELNSFPILGRHSIMELIIRLFLKSGIRGGRLPFDNCCDNMYWFLSVDDNLFYKPFRLSEVIYFLEKNPKAIGFSLRLGKNINFCYMKNTPQHPPRFDRYNDGDILSFDWENSEHDFGYPLEISSSVYRSALITSLMAGLYFTTPNMLESKMAALKKWYSVRFQKLLCYSVSVSFCNPINKVQSDRPQNRGGQEEFYTIEQLANLFDQGKRVDLDVLHDFVPNACHQELDLKFVEVP